MRIHGSTYAYFGVAFVTAALAGACSATVGGSDFHPSTSAGGGSTQSSGTDGQGGFDFGTGGSTGTGNVIIDPPCDFKEPTGDHDGDGFTVEGGDCNDCSAAMNPGAQDFAGNGVDEDCNGAADDNVASCDSGLSVTSTNPVDGAKALGICKLAEGKSWGLISAQYVGADGAPLDNYDPQGLGHGILSGFGPNTHVQEGSKLLALSSGTARQPNDPGYQDVGGYDKEYTTNAPPGYPKESPSCPGVFTGEPHDSAGLLLKIKTPTNAKSLKFNLNFYTYEWPVFICSTYNDFFVAMLTPVPKGQPDGNISFDSMGNLISVNAGFLEACSCGGGSPCQAGGKNFACSLGDGPLQQTGFESHAATGWLATSSPVQIPGGPISLLFAVWDSGDGVLDSTVLLDNFTFDVDAATTTTAPVEVPK